MSYEFNADQFRTDGHALIDSIAKLIEEEAVPPILRPSTGEAVKEAIDSPLPETTTQTGDLIKECLQQHADFGRKNGNPRFFGYVCASADPISVLADTLIAGLNQNVTSWRSAPAATEMEKTVVRWLDEFVGFGGEGHGLLVSGGSAANLTALICAVEKMAETDADRSLMTIYLSKETHLSLKKAAKSLGIPTKNIRSIDVNSDRQLLPGSLQSLIEHDKEQGLNPTCVVASAGTANTGAVDPLESCAALAKEHGLWYHIDGAYGAPAAATPTHFWMKEGFVKADSISLDPHKWLFCSFDVGCILIRDAERSKRAFSLQSEYVKVTQTDPIESHAFFDHGLELSRRFRALKPWLIFKSRGAPAIAAEIQRNIDLRLQLDARLAREPELEEMGSGLSISCFRYVGNGNVDPNVVNQRILETLVESGEFFMSPTTLDGKYALRVCIVNFRTQRDDLEALVDEVLRLGRAE